MPVVVGEITAGSLDEVELIEGGLVDDGLVEDVEAFEEGEWAEVGSDTAGFESEGTGDADGEEDYLVLEEALADLDSEDLAAVIEGVREDYIASEDLDDLAELQDVAKVDVSGSAGEGCVDGEFAVNIMDERPTLVDTSPSDTPLAATSDTVPEPIDFGSASLLPDADHEEGKLSDEPAAPGRLAEVASVIRVADGADELAGQ